MILRSPDVPNDTAFVNQKYINMINVLPVWKDYTGKGVSVGVFEPGSEYAVEHEVFDYRHPDLSPNVDPTWLAQGNPPATFSQADVWKSAV